MERILVVDDEPSLLFTLVANLELEGFEVREACDAQSALAILRDTPVDLVLSDVRMPGMSGVDLYRAIRALHPQLPVILSTAFAVEELVESAIHEGVFTVLPKPCEIKHVVAALTRALKRPAVLVIDDDEPVAETTADGLCAAGVKALWARDGHTAIDIVRAGDVDVVVVDMVMPDLTGPEVIEKILALDPNIACIGVSGHDVPDLLRRAGTNTQRFMRKPVAPTALLSAVANARKPSAIARDKRAQPK